MKADKYISILCGGCAALCIVLSFLSSPAFSIYAAAFGFVTGGLFERAINRSTAIRALIGTDPTTDRGEG